jgi:peptidoglycan/LPS O-acetylase OafA/YrhL
MDALDRQNSFTWIRQVLALAVVVAHAWYLGGFGSDPLYKWSGHQLTGGSFAVLCFFVISGYLITASAERQPIWRFCLHRCARILPGFWVVQLLTAFALAPTLILAKHDWVDGYWAAFTLGENSASAYLWNNAFIHIQQYTIADLFHEPGREPAINGSLWSLGPEITCYLYLALFVAFRCLRHKGLVLGIFLSVYGLYLGTFLNPSLVPLVSEVLSYGGFQTLVNPLFRAVYVAFLAGMTFYKFRDKLRLNVSMFLVCVSALVGSIYLQCFDLIWPLTLPYILLYLGYVLPFRGFERFGDYSFGIYIFSFPIQQCLRLWGVHDAGLLVYVALSVVLSVLAGVLSWFIVEAPALRWAKRVGKRETVLEPSSARPTAAVTCTTNLGAAPASS